MNQLVASKRKPQDFLTPEEHEKIFGYRPEPAPALHMPQEAGTEPDAPGYDTRDIVLLLASGAKRGRLREIKEALKAAGAPVRGGRLGEPRHKFLLRRRCHQKFAHEPALLFVRRWRFLPLALDWVIVTGEYDDGERKAFHVYDPRQSGASADLLGNALWSREKLERLWRGWFGRAHALWLELER